MRSLTFLSFLILLPHFAFASGLKVTRWIENSTLTNYGKISEVSIESKIEDIPSNQAMTAFSLSFDQRQKITINKVICDNKTAKYSFINNNLIIFFPKPKLNGNSSIIELSYDEHYEKVHKYLRSERIYVPDFAEGADTKVTLKFPWSLESATLNPNVEQYANEFVYSNRVPPGGVSEVIKLTPTETVWDINVKTTMTAGEPLGRVSITTPAIFFNHFQRVEKFSFTSSINPLRYTKNEDHSRTLNFDTNTNKIIINNKARIHTGRKNRKQIERDPEDYLTINSNEKDALRPLLEAIRKDQKYGNIPFYAKIGRFVHNFITYDLSYTGKKLPVKEIIVGRRGVCEEFATLFTALARAADIPSITIGGRSCGEYDKCQDHAWNMIYINGKWIEVDPTWDLMSGVVSSSHVYFYDTDKGDFQFMFESKKNQSPPNIELESEGTEVGARN